MKKEVLIKALQKRQRKNKQQEFNNKVTSIFIKNWLRRISFIEKYINERSKYEWGRNPRYIRKSN